MDAIALAATEGLTRDAIWRTPPPLASGCEHDLRCLPCIEYRQTVLCAKCGGLDTALSQAIPAAPGSFIIHQDGRITRTVLLLLITGRLLQRSRPTPAPRPPCRTDQRSAQTVNRGG